ncbi:MAG: hypothetical protein ACREF5_03240 [Candidatus Saccharimonadales bacterium]
MPNFIHNFFSNQTLVTTTIIVVLVLVVIFGVVQRLRPRKLKAQNFQLRWKEIEKMCGKSEMWPTAIISADELLDEALKTRRLRGKTMGERLVSAQRTLNNNESVWFGHKLRNKIIHEEVSKLYRRDVQIAVRGFRDALKDLGAL